MEFNAFESIKIGLASPEQILKWSFGEVKPSMDFRFCNSYDWNSEFVWKPYQLFELF